MSESSFQDVASRVAAVVAAVRERGDEALCEFARQWDGAALRPSALRVPRDAIEQADVTTPFAQAFARAVTRIRRFHEAQKPRSTVLEDPEGVTLEMRWTALRSVGLYIPGGKASYPSTLAMTAVPAQVAGVERIAVVSPPGPSGEVCTEVLQAAKILGLSEIYRAGGAQAVAALALGTRAIARVDKIVGPGNAYVAEAKRQLFGEVGIDLIAGPSEIVVYADESAEPELVAADLLAQAEHDEATRPILIASSPDVLAQARAAIERRVALEPRASIIRAALERGGRFEVAASLDDAARRIDAIAPEHLSIQSASPRTLLAKVRNAGAIYLGSSSPVALGDYYAGPSHVLPTSGTARFASVLSVEDFMKRSSVVEASAEFLVRHGADVITLAEGERLPAHANSIRARTQPLAAVRAGLRAVAAYELVEESAEVKLNQNESPWDVPVEIKDRVLKRVREAAWNRYPQGLAEQFRDAIARSTGVPREGVLIGTGSNLILQWLFEALGGPGRFALAPRPSFSLYRMWARVSETRFAEFSLTPSFEYPVAEILARIESERPSLVVLCLPNNPTGSELDPQAVGEIAGAAERVGGVLVVDEAYREFSGPRFDRTPLARERKNVVLVRTASKAFAAAGLRLGYVLTGAELGAHLVKIVPPFHVGHFLAAAGLELWGAEALFRDRVREILRERERLFAALGAIPGVETLPSEANFFLIRVANARAVFLALKARSVLVRQTGSDPALAGCLRVTTGTPAENDRLAAALRDVMKGA